MNKEKTREPISSLSQIVRNVQASLFDRLSISLPCRTPEHDKLAAVFELVRIEDSIERSWFWTGRPPTDRKALARCFLAKSAWGVPTTKAFRLMLVHDRVLLSLCGLDKVPSEATLSRAFEAFAAMGLAERSHERAVRNLLEGTFALQVSRDSTAILGREKPLQKPRKLRQPKSRPGRKKGVPPKPKAVKRQQVQLEQDWRESVSDLPKACDTGTKRNSKGHDIHWHGFKLHVDVDECGLPLAAITTSASVHDSQVAIPLMRMTAERTSALYQIMDAGYVGEPIILAAEKLGQVTIIKPKATKTSPAMPLDPHEESRYRARNVVERFFSDLKDNHGGNSVRVRGYPKVNQHLMFGVLALFALVLLRQ